jgi:hypothetical protein
MDIENRAQLLSALKTQTKMHLNKAKESRLNEKRDAEPN